MAEFTTKPSGPDSDPDALRWATTAAQGVDYIEPPGAKLNSGWVFQDVPPYHTLNWFYRLAALMIAWLTAWRIRAFDSLESAVSVVDDGHVFIVGRPSGFTQPFGQVWSVAGGMAAPTDALSCDGEWVYYAVADVIYRASRLDGTDVTSRSLVASINCIIATGAYVFAVTDANGGTEVRILDRLTLADVAPFPLGPGSNCVACASNGQLCVTGVGSNADTWNLAGSTGSVAHGSTVLSLAMDWGAFYTAGAVTIKSWTLANMLNWSINFPGISQANDMATDGVQLFVACHVGAFDGQTFNVLAIDRETGRINWYAATPDPGSAVNALAAAVDDKWLYIGAGNLIHKLDKITGQTVGTFNNNAAVTHLDADGDAIFVGGASDGGNYMKRLDAGHGSRMFIKASGTDGFRPFTKLAIPAK